MEKIVAESPHQVIVRISNSIIALAEQSIADTGQFSIALSGGNTPKLLYQYLISSNLFSAIDLSKIFIYFSDERYVAHEDERSNYGLARDHLLSFIDIPTSNIFAVNTSFESPAESAQKYQELIMNNLSRGNVKIPAFDLIILGMGTDGHTASLFPGIELLNADKILVGNCYHPESNTDRISFTFPLINAAKNIYIIAVGEGKFPVLNDIFNVENKGIIKYPIQNIKPMHNLLWFTDHAAMFGR